MAGMSDEERLELTRGILNMLDEWEVEGRDQLALLGLPDVPARELVRMRESRPLPDEPEVMQRIRDPFFTTKRDAGGTGLGLAISDRIVRDHEGMMTFISEPGRGTTVSVNFPVRTNRRQQGEKAE